MSITQIGNSFIPTSSKRLQLNYALYVPKLTQNLLSVHHICLDNNCYMIFYTLHFWIQDKATGRIVYEGNCSNGLYPFHFSPRADLPMINFQPLSLFGKLVLSSTYHHKLGHPKNKIIHTMLKKENISCFINSTAVMCASCLQGKFCKLPFHSSVHKSVKPFHIIHNDVGGSSPSISVDAYRFYLIFVEEFTQYC